MIGRRLRDAQRLAHPGATSATRADPSRFERRSTLTVIVIGASIAGVIAFPLDIGLAASWPASMLVLMAVADETAAMKQVP